MRKLTAILAAVALLFFYAGTAGAGATSEDGWGGGLPGNIIIEVDVTNESGATDTYVLPEFVDRYRARIIYRLWVYSPDDDSITVTLATDPDGDDSYANILVTGTTTAATDGEAISTGNAPFVGETQLSVSGLDDTETAVVYIIAY